MFILKLAFWLSFGVIIYVLWGYPLLSLILAMVIRKQNDKKPITPTVSFIITAYNEEGVIAQKIEQTLELDYPVDKLEIIVASDGSTDHTDEIACSFADKGVKFHRVEGRKGKTNAQNEAVEIATGEILFFSDATGFYNKEAIKEIVSNFNDPTVGCVTGRVVYSYGKDLTSTGFKAYQRLVVAIRKAEMLFGSQTSVSGSIHAIRRKLFIPANPAYSYDVVNAIHAVTQGYRVVYENKAVSREMSRTTLWEEFNCRVRMSIRAKPMISYIFCTLFTNKNYCYLLQMISHKFMRWFLWCPLFVLFATNIILMLHGEIYKIFAVAQILFYAAGISGFLFGMFGIRFPFLSLIMFFVMTNIASCVGTIKYLFGKKMDAWEPARQPN